jgi:hypothetical protein
VSPSVDRHCRVVLLQGRRRQRSVPAKTVTVRKFIFVFSIEMICLQSSVSAFYCGFVPAVQKSVLRAAYWLVSFHGAFPHRNE